MRATLAAWGALRRCPTPWVAHQHGWLGHTHNLRGRLYETIDRRLIGCADKVITGSIAAKREVEAAGAHSVCLIPNAVPIPELTTYESSRLEIHYRLGVPRHALVVGIFGRIHPGKGHEVLMQAIAAMKDDNIDIHAIVVGVGPKLENLKRLCDSLAISHRIHFTGYVDDVNAYYAACDLCVVPSFKESLPLTALEAMAMAKPVIASNTGDLPRVIRNGIDGFIFPPGDTSALHQALRRAAIDRDALRSMSASARNRIIREFSISSMVNHLQTLFEKMLDAHTVE